MSIETLLVRLFAFNQITIWCHKTMVERVAKIPNQRSGLGAPTDPDVLRQAAVVTQSVFSHQDLLNFMKQTRIDKRAQIRRLALLVAGVRVFNWETHR